MHHGGFNKLLYNVHAILQIDKTSHIVSHSHEDSSHCPRFYWGKSIPTIRKVPTIVLSCESNLSLHRYWNEFDSAVVQEARGLSFYIFLGCKAVRTICILYKCSVICRKRKKKTSFPYQVQLISIQWEGCRNLICFQKPLC